MLFLLTDTSGKNGYVALARVHEGAEPPTVIESVPLAGGTFSAQLVPQIAELLGKHGVSKGDIDAFVVVSGPGSFTGLRVGLAAIKALGEILRKPIVPISLLEVVAFSSGVEGKVIAALDAGRGEVYAGSYQVSHEGAALVEETLVTRNDLLCAAAGKLIATPDEALAAALANSGETTPKVTAVGADVMARLGWRKLRAGQTVSPEQLEANYIRRSDAEIFAKPASGA